MNEPLDANTLTKVTEFATTPSGWFNISKSGDLILEGIAVSGAVIVMIVGMVFVFNRLKQLNQGFGPNSLKSLGLVLFLPSLVLLALLTDFKTETLAALLGTVAGYVLSNSEEKTKPPNSTQRSTTDSDKVA